MQNFDKKYLHKNGSDIARFIKENIFSNFELRHIDEKEIVKYLKSRTVLSEGHICELRQRYFSSLSLKLEDFQEKIFWDNNVLLIMCF